AGGALSPVARGARPRLQGRPDRRRRGRGLRRLRHLQGGAGAPLLGATAAVEVAAAPPAAALPVPGRAAVAAGGLSRGVLPHGARCRGRSALLAHAALRADTAHPPVLF